MKQAATLRPTGQSQAADLEWLARAFAASFDQQQLASGQAGPNEQRWQLLGRGAHCRSWLVPHSGPLPLVVKCFEAGPLARPGRQRQRWQRAWRELQRPSLQLVPPGRTWEDRDGRLWQALPYGQLFSKMPLGRPWQPLDQLQDELRQQLSCRGLVLDDVWQIRSCAGIPMIVDWSDLKPIPQQLTLIR